MASAVGAAYGPRMFRTGLDTAFTHPSQWWEQLMEEVQTERPLLYAPNAAEGLSLKVLNAAAHCLAAYWQMRGLKAGEAVVLLTASDWWLPAIDMAAQMAGGLTLALDPRMPESQLRGLVREIGARFYYTTDYRLYTQFREWLDPMTSVPQMICNTDRGDKLQENDRLTTLEAALFVGKNWWRENLDLVQRRKTEPPAATPGARWVEVADGRYVLREMSRAERMHWLRAQLATVREWPARPRVLSVAHESSAWAEGLGVYWPLRVAERLYLCPPQHASVLQQLRQQRINVLVATEDWLTGFTKQLAKQFQLEHPMRRRYLHSAYRNDQRLRAAAHRGESAGFTSKLGRWPSRRFIFQKLKRRYLPTLQVVVAEPGPKTEELRNFFAPLGVRLLIDSGHDAMSRASSKRLQAVPVVEVAEA